MKQISSGQLITGPEWQLLDYTDFIRKKYFIIFLFFPKKNLGGIKNYPYLCNKKRKDMPTILLAFGLRFYFYSEEHMPIHVHVENADGRVMMNNYGKD